MERLYRRLDSVSKILGKEFVDHSYEIYLFNALKIDAHGRQALIRASKEPQTLNEMNRIVGGRRKLLELETLSLMKEKGIKDANGKLSLNYELPSLGMTFVQTAGDILYEPLLAKLTIEEESFDPRKHDLTKII